MTLDESSYVVDAEYGVGGKNKVTRVTWFSFGTLQVRSSLTVETTKTLVHAFISSRLDYCNSLLYGVNDGLLKKLQAVQNASARVTTETRKFDHIAAPPYLAVDCVPVTSLPSRRHLRSADSGCLAVTGTMTTLGSRNFAVAGAKVWNSLPVDLRLLSRSLRTFGHKLKHYLFVSEP